MLELLITLDFVNCKCCINYTGVFHLHMRGSFVYHQLGHCCGCPMFHSAVLGNESTLLLTQLPAHMPGKQNMMSQVLGVQPNVGDADGIPAFSLAQSRHMRATEG